MTKPTEELALSKGATVNSTGDVFSFSRKELQAFREAVDAERMKQQPMRYLYRYELLGGTALYSELRGSEEPLDVIPLYAQPFPSTEQLQQRVKELKDALQMAHDYLEPRVSGNGITGRTVVLPAIKKALANTQGDSK